MQQGYQKILTESLVDGYKSAAGVRQFVAQLMKLGNVVPAKLSADVLTGLGFIEEVNEHLQKEILSSGISLPEALNKYPGDSRGET
ncbi:hypothetical protein A6S26_05235 [Nostoc sp. ATCC 43529]|nr:hypothetical protein A6S26_05235 [Nostoc sp. ATCC 43529]